jgi:hypothetical protein
MNPELKKIMLTRLRDRFILLVAGVVLVSAGWKKSGWPADVLVIGGAILALYAFMTIMGLLLTWHEIRKKTEEEETGILQPDSYINWPPWFNRGAAFVIHILLFIGITFGASRHENDFGGLSFLIHSLVAGLLTGYGVFHLLSLYFTSWNDHKNKRVEIAFYIILVTVFLFVSLGPVLNEYWARSSSECKNYVIESSYRQRRLKEKYIRVRTEDRTERFEPSPAILRRLNPGDSMITLCIKKGALGYKFVDEFRIPVKTRTNPGNP